MAQVQVTRTYPGAAADIIESTIALPTEQQVTSIDNMLYTLSMSDANGGYMPTVTFQRRVITCRSSKS